MKDSAAEVIPVLFILLLLGQQALSSLEVRLAGGSSVNEGRLEVFYNGTWGTVCDLKYVRYTCRTVCLHLGYSWNYAYRRYDAGNLTTWLQYIRCNEPQLDLEDCHHTPWEEQSCSGVQRGGCFCQLPPSGTLRLVGGSTAHEGKVEVFYNEMGTWGGVCGDVFHRDNIGCAVVCRQLGYSGAAVPRRFGPGASNTSVWLDDVICDGSERRLVDCDHCLRETRQCSSDDNAGCSCEGNEGDVRLVGGSTISEGRIEVLYNDTWGDVCYHDSHFRQCAVVCSQLGYSGSAVYNDFGVGIGHVWLDGVICQGNESHITDCSHQPWGVVLTYYCRNRYAYGDAGCVCEPSNDVNDNTTAFDTCKEAETTITPSQCHSDLCWHGGTCMDTDGSYQCLCLSNLTVQYTGVHCETAVYTVPRVREVSPQYGPEAGGTLITLVGSHLAIGNDSVNVYLGDASCQTVSQDNDAITVRTPKLPNGTATDQKLQIRVVFLSGLEAEMNQPLTFEYRGNPVIKSVKPLEAIAQGGIELTVTGSSFDSVAQPIMVITAKYNSTQKKYHTPCEVQTTERLICLSPTIDTFLPRVERSKRDVAEFDEVEYHISFLLDGVDDYNEDNFARNVPEYSRLGIIAEPPKVIYWDDVVTLKPGEILTIFAQEGEDLQRGCTINDYRVNIDREMCGGLKFHTNSLQCETPTNTTGFGEKGDGKGNLRVVMYIGNHSDFIGHMRYLYESGDTPNTWLLIGGGLAVLLLILAGISTYIVRRKVRTRQQKEQASYRRRQRAMQRRTLDVPPQINFEDFQRLRASERFEGSPKMVHDYLTTRSDYLQIINRNDIPDQGEYLPPMPDARGPSGYHNTSSGPESGFGISTFGSNDWHQHELQSLQGSVASPLYENTTLTERYTRAQMPRIDQHNYENMRQDDQSMLAFPVADTQGHSMTLGQSRSEIDRYSLARDTGQYHSNHQLRF